MPPFPDIETEEPSASITFFPRRKERIGSIVPSGYPRAGVRIRPKLAVAEASRLARKPLFVQLRRMSHLPPGETRRFGDLSNWDALFAAAFGIAVSEAAASLSLVSGAGQVGAGMLAAGLFVSVRLCWPMAHRAWFWPLAAGMALVDAALIAAAHWTDNWVPALALSPLTFVEVWLFTKLASAFESNEGP